MTTKKVSKTISDSISQIDKFKGAARELECDDDEKRFADKLGKLVKPAKLREVGPPYKGKRDTDNNSK